MGLPIATITSACAGTCYCHDSPIPQNGTIVSGSSTVYANGLGVAKLGDVVLANCGHTAVLVDSSKTVYADSIGVCALSSFFTGCFIGTVVAGSLDVNTEK